MHGRGRQCLRLFSTLAVHSAISVTSSPDADQLQSLGVSRWPIWTCGVSTFPWTYDEQETCLLLEGDVTVTPMKTFPIIRDLVTDVSFNYAMAERVPALLPPPMPEGGYRMFQEDVEREIGRAHV